MDTRKTLISYLADGKFHSGETLARSLGVSRTAVWKQVRKLERYGLVIQSVPGRGYRLAQVLELLDAERIQSYLPTRASAVLEHLEIDFETDSTNQRLMNRIPGKPIHAWVALAEFQSAGRGRRGTSWISPVGSGIIMSVGWRYEVPAEPISALSLAAGVAAVAALARAGVTGISLKWPNDIICEGRKIGGILIETRGEAAGPYDVVLGIGINVCLPSHVFAMIDQPVTDLAGITGTDLSRNRLAALMISEIFDMFTTFGSEGFSAFIGKWRKLDYYYHREASLLLAGETINGRVLGINQNGFLSMSIDGEQRLFGSGDLSLRALP